MQEAADTPLTNNLLLTVDGTLVDMSGDVPEPGRMLLFGLGLASWVSAKKVAGTAGLRQRTAGVRAKPAE
ncbi:MAG: PEP-CTERM sorting domain-containing protein [Bryobacteraceae bacterium]